MQTLVHYGLHFGFPLVISYIFFKKDWAKTYMILIATMLVDLDHLFSTPIFDANRCSIGFHYLHSYYAIAIYVLLLFMRRPIKIIAIGLLFHMLTDFIDCLYMYSNCPPCMSSDAAYPILSFLLGS